MEANDKFNCFIIGQDTLLIQCAQILLDNEHTICGIISSADVVKCWAQERNIPHIEPGDNITAFLSQQPFDYLFSIINEQILTAEVLKLPRKFAINYHNSLLPKYAGSYATSWALMQGEITHGVTWHLISQQVDAGDILKQDTVDIAAGDTTWTLNIKCFSAAIRSFGELVADLEHGSLSPRMQSLAERSFFPRYKRPPSGCILSWKQPAQYIDAFVRALSFGPYNNPLGLPKLGLKNSFFTLNRIDVLSTSSHTVPGIIVAIKQTSIIVSTASNDVEIHELLTIDGEYLPISDLVARFALYVGYPLNDLDQDIADLITNYNASTCKNELFWSKKLEELQPIKFSISSYRSNINLDNYSSIDITIPDVFFITLKNHHPTWSAHDFLLAAFLAYLARIEDQTIFDIGIKLANQEQTLIGIENFFASHVPFRFEADPAQSFEKLFYRILEQVQVIKKHKTYARDIIARYPALRSRLSSSMGTAYQVLVEQVEDLDDFRPTPGSSLTFVLAEKKTQYTWVYCADSLDKNSVMRMSQQFSTFLINCITHVTQRYDTIPLLTAKERQQLLVDWNITQTPYRQDQCIHELFEGQVQQTPDAIAVVWEEIYISYAELNERANQVGHYLCTLGVGPEVLVGICVERSLDMVVGVLGVLKAGGAYVPLDPSYPSERLAFMLRDAQVAVLLTQHRLREHLPIEQEQVVCLDTDWSTICLSPRDNVLRSQNHLSPENLAYVIYTSGSTGKPKGTLLSHQGLYNLAKALIDVFSLDSHSRVLQFASFGFDAATGEIFMTLPIGAMLHLITPKAQHSGIAFIQLLHNYAITVVTLPPSFLAILPEAVLPALKTIITVGEACPAQVVATWAKRVRFFNAYGPTETTICATAIECPPSTQRPSIGRPIPNTKIYILDENLEPVPVGTIGELYIGGIRLARGYLKHAALTAERFIPDPFNTQAGARLYKTGDLARYQSDGTIEYEGRIDHQVKLRGLRVELEEIEHVLDQHPAVQQSVVIARENTTGNKHLVGYIIPRKHITSDNTLLKQDLLPGDALQSTSLPSATSLQLFLKPLLPDYMIPSAFVTLEQLPLTPNGKFDRHALPIPENLPPTTAAYVAPQTDVESIIASIWRDLLHVDQVGLNDNFFDLGGNSLHIIQLHDKIQEIFQIDLLIELFKYPTISSLARYIHSGQQEEHFGQESIDQDKEPVKSDHNYSRNIAIIGMAGQFPQAANIDEFWENLRNGVESISNFSEEELISAGVDVSLLANSNYVRAGSFLADIESFDASFFGYSPAEAQLIDPQQRLFLECASQGLEHAGYNPEAYRKPIGIYAGIGVNTYLLSNLQRHQNLTNTADNFQLMISNGNDFLSTRVSYRLNLTGPSVTVQTACSTSLVAIHMACQGLISGECSIALAGGASLRFPRKAGYLYQEGGTTSPDGHCRAFDAQAQGTVIGEGVSIVVLKRLADAITDGDSIYAVIKGSAINNDGARKVGYTAPSIEGQAQVIRTAHQVAGVSAETISYVEAHGTGTTLGDPIEIAALTQAFGNQGSRTGWCAIGSVKTNIGHLDAAAGVAGLIKTVLALKHRELPPSLHFTQPNPQIDFAHSPFYVNTTLSPWESKGEPRRAGISSFGIGGTNAHIILEEAPPPISREIHTPAFWHLLPLSAKSQTALNRQISNLQDHLQTHPELNLADVASTLQMGRRSFSQRAILVSQSVPDATRTLATTDAEALLTSTHQEKVNAIAFLFPGQGTQYVHMAHGLYYQHRVFRDLLDHCADLLKPLLGLDLRNVLLLKEEGQQDRSQASQRLQQTWLTQPALFVVEYALARLWMSWGVHPQAMIGHSIGEYVAACLAGVMTLEDALALVATRGRLIQSLPAGAMLAVWYPPQELQSLLGPQLSLAAENVTGQCVISGPNKAIETLREELAAREIPYHSLLTSHAFHSAMMEPIMQNFIEHVQRIILKAPRIPYISNVTGTWISAEQATDPQYWARHLRQTVKFAAGLQTLLGHPQQILLEVGPGHTLSGFARQYVLQQTQGEKPPLIISSLPQANEEQADGAFILNTLGRMWLLGVEVEWSALHAQQHVQRIPLPTYPFERQRYWIDTKQPASETTTDNQLLSATTAIAKKNDIAGWFYVPFWKPSPPLTNAPEVAPTQNLCWLLFTENWSPTPANNAAGIGQRLAQHLIQVGQDVVIVVPGEHFAQLDTQTYMLNPNRREDYESLVQELEALNKVFQRVVHAWSTLRHDLEQTDDGSFDMYQTLGFYSLLFLVQALENRQSTASLHLWIISTNMQHVVGETVLHPEKATLLGLCKVIPQEYPFLRCTSIDLVLPSARGWQEKKLLDLLITDLMADSSDTIIAYRDNQRWVQSFEAIRVENKPARTFLLRDEGVYLITGGLGHIGLVLAKYLAQAVHAKIILLGRRKFPAKSEWAHWIDTHDEQNETSLKIREIEAIEGIGAEVLVISADVANEQHMQAALAQITQHFGKLHGVIHLAGIVEKNELFTLHEAEINACERQFRPKVRGLLVLEKILQGRNLDFCLLQSSLSSVLGGFKLGIYAAANLFMDAFAHKQSLITAIPWISVNWDSWRGEAAQSTQKIAFDATQLRSGLTPQEGAEVFHRLFSLYSYASYAQVIVATEPLQVQIDQWITRAGLPQPIDAEQENFASKHTRPELQNSYVAPRNELEQKIAAVWQTLLGIDQIGIYDNFLELGGHSLLAVQVIARLHTILQVKLHLQDFFNTPTIAGSAKQATSSHQLTSHPIRPAVRGEHLPLSFSQQRLWFLDQYMPESCLYIIPGAFYLQGNLDVKILELCLQEILRRHEILRTNFANVDGQGVQIISPVLSLALPLVDLSTLEQDQKLAEVKRLATQEAEHPFRLAKEPLIRVKLLRLGHQLGSYKDIQNPVNIPAGEHLLLFTLHHIITDGWSMNVLLHELRTLYTAFSSGLPSTLPDLPIQYADYALWQREWVRSQEFEIQRNYWKQKLSDIHPFLALPIDKPRPEILTYRGTQQLFSLPKTLTEELKRFSLREGVTLFMTLLATFQVLLFRYTQQTDILVGTPVANRNHSEIEQLIGFFVNTLVIHGDLSGNPRFIEFLRKVRDVTLEAFSHQDLPFEQLVEIVQPERSLSHSPLFQVMFSLQDRPASQNDSTSITLKPFPVENGTAKFELIFDLVEDANIGLIGNVEYNIDLFEASTISRFITHFQQILESVVACPDQHLATLSLLPQKERQQMLIDWNDTLATYPQEQCIHELFENQVQRTPDAIALTWELEQISYAELNERANQVGHYLRTLGVGPEVLVGICVERSLDMVVGVLGVLKAGGAYVPLDPSYPSERLAFMLRDAQVAALLTQHRLREHLPIEQEQVVCLDTDWSTICLSPRDNVLRSQNNLSPENLAYVIYTSGSTGKPKGVQITHSGVVNLVTAEKQTFVVHAQSHILQFATFSFDAWGFETFMALLQGATLYLCSREITLSAADLLHFLDAHAISIVVVPPSLLAILPETDLSALDTIIVAGEACPAQVVARWARGRQFFNAYGPTEATVWSSVAACTSETQRPPIGGPIINTQLYILDAYLEPLPVGVIGELYIGGAGLARGYLKHPERTAERFIPNPFSTQAGARLYKTGDLARYQSDGTIEYVGRIDHQIKLRGFRIELEEIEHILNQHPEVLQNTVVLREDVADAKRLVAYIVKKDPVDANSEQSAFFIQSLRLLLQEKLPSYMVPSAFALLQSLPLTPAGKVNREALLPPERYYVRNEAAYIAPSTETEQIIAAVWQELLHIEKISTQDNFFDLGGHSLLMSQVHNKLQEKLQRDISMIELFKYTTIQALSTYLSQNGKSLGTDPIQKSIHKELIAGKNRLKEQRQKRIKRDA